MKKVIDRLMDDESVYYYNKRLAYYKTGDSKHLLDMIKHLPEIETWDKYVRLCKDLGDKLIIYGACADAEIFVQLYPDVDCLCFCDRDKHKQETGWYGKPVISPEVLFDKYRDNPILINASDYHQEIYDYLICNGIPNENIYNKGKEIAESYPMQYFDRDIMAPICDEIFIDAGCFDLNTARRFAAWCGGNYKKIYSFEPNKENYDFCKDMLKVEPIEKLDLLNLGTWDKKESLSFLMNGEGSAITSGDNCKQSVTIEADSIDNIVGDDRVTFIKLDVEGAELKTLMGASEVIKRDHPRMAISIYHKPEDIVEIPEYVLSLCGDYKFYIRHYKLSYYETVLYCV